MEVKHITVLAHLLITDYLINSPGMYISSIDTSVQVRDLIDRIKTLGGTLQIIEDEIIKMDQFGLLGHEGSGDRERSLVMDYVKEMWDEC